MLLVQVWLRLTALPFSPPPTFLGSFLNSHFDLAMFTSTIIRDWRCCSPQETPSPHWSPLASVDPGCYLVTQSTYSRL
ncbi:hypothetical protein EDC04DRAFT_2725377 [Pisolithus marmoratus]|nr:hypothetical protein EDC04DRAFT_2725377 [Pisolithus marmoratus]